MARKILTSSMTPAGSNFHYYQIPKGMLKVTIKETPASSGQFEVKAEKHIIPDPDNRQFLQYHANAFSDDKIDIQFTTEGFLKRIDTTMEDKTGAVVEAVVDTVAQVVKGAVGLRSLDGQERIWFEETIDPFNEATMERVNAITQKIGPGFELSVKSLATQPSSREAEPPAAGEELAASRFGIFCRPIEPYEFIIKSGTLEQRQLVMLPHHEVMHFVEIPYARFVSNKFTMEFNDTAYPTSIHVEKPSQAQALIEIPLRIIKAIMEIPASIFRFRIDYNTQKLGSLQSEESFKAALRQREENEARLREEAANARNAATQAQAELKDAQSEIRTLQTNFANS